MVISPDTRGRGRRHRQGLHRLRTDHHPARRRHRLHRLGGPAAMPTRQSSTPKSWRRFPTVEYVALPGDPRRANGAHRARRRRCRHPPGVRAGRAARSGLRRGPHLPGRLHHRRQHRHERGRQEGRALGHHAGQSGVLAHGDARRATGSRWSASTTTWARSTSRPRCAFASAASRPTARRTRGEPEDHRDARQPVPQGGPRQGRHRQVPRRSARRAEGRLRRPDHLGAFRAAPHAGACAHACAWSSSAPTCRAPCPPSSRSRTSSMPGRRCALSGLEHLDERYIRAVKYTTKASRRELPKMVLLADLVSDDEAVARSRSPRPWCELARARDAEGFIAVSAEARKRFWIDRARTAAISAHTNAFKINEDVVIPLERLADYSARHRAHQHRAVDPQQAEDHGRQCCAYLEGPMPEAHLSGDDYGDSAESTAILDAKKDGGTRRTCTHARDALAAHSRQSGRPRRRPSAPAAREGAAALRDGDSLLAHDAAPRSGAVLPQGGGSTTQRDLRRPGHGVRCASGSKPSTRRSATSACSSPCTCTPATATCTPTSPCIRPTTPCCRRPTASSTASWRWPESLDGVISGEHGIGLTKIQYLEPDKLEAFARYKQTVDPHGRFNKGKLMPGSGLHGAYTPVAAPGAAGGHHPGGERARRPQRRHQALPALRQVQAGVLTHVPRANLLYSPRNKILGTGLIIEAFLYEEQTRRGLSLAPFRRDERRGRPLHRLPQVP